MTPQTERADLLAALRWQIDAGVDEATLDTAADRFAEHKKGMSPAAAMATAPTPTPTPDTDPLALAATLIRRAAPLIRLR